MLEQQKTLRFFLVGSIHLSLNNIILYLRLQVYCSIPVQLCHALFNSLTETKIIVLCRWCKTPIIALYRWCKIPLIALYRWCKTSNIAMCGVGVRPQFIALWRWCKSPVELWTPV